MSINVNVSEIAKKCESLRNEIGKVIVGKSEVIDNVLMSVLCGGHVLLEDVPGTGKTTLAKALAKSIACGYKRIQFTPDLLPSDLTGVHFYNQKESEFVFRPGPVFTNILLADEINRATPRTQSSLLECMEERQVTVDGETTALSAPFLVIATQNPLELHGTFPLPEAQLDRFFVKISVGYPDAAEENLMLTRFQNDNPSETVNAACTGEEIIDMQNSVKGVHLSESIREYIVAISEATRAQSDISLGVSPRGSLALMRASQATAAMEGSEFVRPDDVQKCVVPVLSHRIICKNIGMARATELNRQRLLDVLSQVKVPLDE